MLSYNALLQSLTERHEKRKRANDILRSVPEPFVAEVAQHLGAPPERITWGTGFGDEYEPYVLHLIDDEAKFVVRVEFQIEARKLHVEISVHAKISGGYIELSANNNESILVAFAPVLDTRNLSAVAYQAADYVGDLLDGGRTYESD